MAKMFDTPRDLHIFAVGGDALGGLVDCLETRTAVAADAGAGDLHRKVGDEGGHFGDIEVLFLLLLDTAPVDVFDQVFTDAGALDQRPHQVGGDFVRAPIPINPFFR